MWTTCDLYRYYRVGKEQVRCGDRKELGYLWDQVSWRGESFGRFSRGSGRLQNGAFPLVLAPILHYRFPLFGTFW